MKHDALNLRAEFRRQQRNERTKWFAIWACFFAVQWFAIHFVMRG